MMMNRRHGERGELEVEMSVENIYKKTKYFPWIGNQLNRELCRSKNGGELDMIVEDIDLCIIRNGSKLYSEEKARQWVELVLYLED